MRAWSVAMVMVLSAAVTMEAAAAKNPVKHKQRRAAQAAPAKAPAKAPVKAPAKAPSPTPSPATAAQPAVPAPQPEEIVAGGIVILRLRTTVGGMTPADRSAAIYERINTIISDRKVQPPDVKAVKKGLDWVVMAGPHLFVTATPDEAIANKATPMELAHIWASNLRIAIPLARPEPVVLPPK